MVTGSGIVGVVILNSPRLLTKDIEMTKQIKKPRIKLKWGTLKGCDNIDTGSEYYKKLEAYLADGSTLSCMQDNPDLSRKQILCDAIDLFDGTIINDWSGEIMTAEQAKKYVMEYK